MNLLDRPAVCPDCHTPMTVFNNEDGQPVYVACKVKGCEGWEWEPEEPFTSPPTMRDVANAHDFGDLFAAEIDRLTALLEAK